VRVTEEDPVGNASAAVVRARAYLPPGDLLVSAAPTAITTILGSCVAVCLWDAGLAVGGMNHFLLPHGSPERLSPTRYGNVSTRELIDRMLGLGCTYPTLRAKVFGGASVIDVSSGRALGGQNALAAQAVLGDRGIAVVASDLGGQRARRLVFQTDDGTAWVRLV
jgi:chemotaxis protein CheD